MSRAHLRWSWPVILALVSALAAPPAAAQYARGLRVCAEWEPAVGTLISWPLGIPKALVIELASDDLLYVLVVSQAAENQARSKFQSWGIDPAQVEYIRAPVQTHWPRDWGPHQVFDENGLWGIVDPIFEGYPWVPVACQPVSSPGGHNGDDAVNADVAQHFGAPLHTMPAYLVGGNFLVDGCSAAFSTCVMLGENAQLWTPAEFLALAEQYLGVEDYCIVGNTENMGIQHIDCWFKPLDEETLLVKRPPVGHEEYDRIEANLAVLEGLTSCYGRPYRIVRIDCDPYDGYNVAAYTNSLILNGKVLVPQFNIPSDPAALQTFADAMPGYEVIGFPWNLWYYYDALHCRTRAVFDRHMLRLQHRRMDQAVPFLAGHEVEVFIDDRSEAGLIAAELRVHWRLEGHASWSSAQLSPTAEADVYAATIPGQAAGSAVEYWIAAADLSGRAETLPRTAPDGFYRYAIDPQAGSPYCLPGANGAQIATTGSGSVSANDLVLFALPVPDGVNGIFFYGDLQRQLPFGNGTLCVDGTVALFRLLPPVNAGHLGVLSYAVDLTDPPNPNGQIHPGTTWNFQAWFRDGPSWDLSDAVEIPFTP